MKRLIDPLPVRTLAKYFAALPKAVDDPVVRFCQMANSLEVALVSASISAVVSLSVAVGSPLLTHTLWKRQKRKEQQLAIAQRFSALYSDYLVWKDKGAGAKTIEELAPINPSWFEFTGVLYLAQVMFIRPEVIQLANTLMQDVDRIDFMTVTQLQAHLFAEALDIPANKVFH